MKIECGPISYEWIDCWAAVPDESLAATGWAHPGVGVNDSGEIVTFHPSEPKLLVLDASGKLLRELSVPLTEGHGITISGGRDVWVADPGAKMVRGEDGSYGGKLGGPKVVRFSPDGREDMTLQRPSIDAYAEGGYAPTDVAVDESSGDIWVADGYGRSFVHRFDGDGSYISSINGEEGGGHFNCPHSIFIDSRHGSPELYVADRGNGRVQVYGLDGTFKRVVGESFLNSPSVFAADGDYLIIGELFARLAVLDSDDNLVCYLGENGEVTKETGWPNAVDAGNHPVAATERLQVGKFNSPHGLASDPDGNLYVAEWLIGGRYTKLAKLGG